MRDLRSPDGADYMAGLCSDGVYPFPAGSDLARMPESTVIMQICNSAHALLEKSIAGDAACSRGWHGALHEHSAWNRFGAYIWNAECAVDFLKGFLRTPASVPTAVPALRAVDPSSIDLDVLALVATALRQPHPDFTPRKQQQRGSRAGYKLLSWAHAVLDEAEFFRNEPEACQLDAELRRLCAIVAGVPVSSRSAARGTQWGALRTRLEELGLGAFIVAPPRGWERRPRRRDSSGQIFSATI